MTKEEKNEFRQLIKEGSLEALQSSEGQLAVINALGSRDGQLAVVAALRSKEGQEAIKTGAFEAFKSPEGKDIFIDYFVEAFHDVVVPVFETYDKKMKQI